MENKNEDTENELYRNYDSLSNNRFVGGSENPSNSDS
jgi:hypothetical protein